MNRSDLEARIASYLHRNDLSAQIPGFIELATVRLARDLRSMFNEVYLDPFTVNADPMPLPQDFRNIRSLAVKADRGPATLRSVGSHGLNRYGNNGGEPLVYTIRGRDLHIRPYQARDYILNYYAAPAELTSGTSENDVLTNYPYLYLYASLVEAYVFIQDTEREQAMIVTYTSELELVNREAKLSRTGDAPAMVSA